MGRSAGNRQGNVMELSGNFTLSGSGHPVINLDVFRISVVFVR